MKIYSMIGYPVFFLAAILLGYQIASSLFQTSTEMDMITQAKTTLIYQPPLIVPEDQVNLLIFSIDRLDAHPQLRTIWLAAIKPGTVFRLLPIYPTSQPASKNDQAILREFTLENQDDLWRPTSSFLNLLQAKNIAWNGFLLLDDAALISLVDTTGQITIDGKRFSQDDLLSSFQNRESLSFQWKLWQELCWNILQSPDNLIYLDTNFFKHLVVDSTLSKETNYWVSLLKSTDVPTCEFP